MAKSLLCICSSFPPEVTPTAIRSGKILEYLQKEWNLQVVTEVQGKVPDSLVNVHPVKSWYPGRLIYWLSRFKFEKLLEWFIWPDRTIFWLLPALLKGKELVKQQESDAIVVFMMPYSAGLVGILLKWLTRRPLVLNFDDSPTCSDMSPSYPTWIHYHMTRWLEDFYISQADAVIYVSQHNLEKVRSRQPKAQHFKFHLVRYGADLKDLKQYSSPESIADSQFSIVYIGGMNGWYEFYHLPQENTVSRKVYRAWMSFGRHEVLKLDYRSSSPIFIGKAVQQVAIGNPNWQNKIHVNVYGNQYSQTIIERVLQNQNVVDVISVFGSLPHNEAIKMACKADLLFLTLPARPDGSLGGRISAKTYEYLMTDRPILAAVPRGENWDYLEGKPGVWLVEPTDVAGMAKAITQLAVAKFSGKPLSFNRSELHEQLSYSTRSEEFDKILTKVCIGR
jgi:glycosyltransferase involved in cell wall biosynthesis